MLKENLITRMKHFPKKDYSNALSDVERELFVEKQMAERNACSKTYCGIMYLQM